MRDIPLVYCDCHEIASTDAPNGKVKVLSGPCCGEFFGPEETVRLQACFRYGHNERHVLPLPNFIIWRETLCPFVPVGWEQWPVGTYSGTAVFRAVETVPRHPYSGCRWTGDLEIPCQYIVSEVSADEYWVTDED